MTRNGGTFPEVWYFMFLYRSRIGIQWQVNRSCAVEIRKGGELTSAVQQDSQMGSIDRGMSGWIQEEEAAGMSGGLEEVKEEEENTVQVTREDTIGVTSSEFGLSERDNSAVWAAEDEEKKELREEVNRLEFDLVELRAKYKKVRGEKRELRRRLASFTSERQVIEVEGGGGEAADAVEEEGGLGEGGEGMGSVLANGEFERLRLANDEKAAEVEALVDRAGQEARRLREEKENLVEALRDAEQR